MRAYDDVYLAEVVETQGKLFTYIANTFPEKDTEDFINVYMKSRTRKSIDEAQAYVNTINSEELWEYFEEIDHYQLKTGRAIECFMASWIGEFYAYYQWYYNIPSAEVNEKIPIEFLKKAYYGLRDLDMDLAVQKVRRYKLDVVEAMEEAKIIGKDPNMKKYSSFSEVMENID